MPNNASSFGAFGPTTNVWDVTELQNIDVKSPEFKELLVRLYQNINLMALVLQVADKGIYDTQEFLNGQLWYPNPANNSTTVSSAQFRQVFRTVINMNDTEPNLPNNATINLPHGIPWNAAMSWTRIYGAATNPTAGADPNPCGIMLPYVSLTAGQSIEMYTTDTNVVITTQADYSAYTICYVVLEYLYQ